MLHRTGLRDLSVSRSRHQLSCPQVYYPDEVQFWNGIVTADNRDGGEAGVQDDRFGCGGLWERFTVVWDRAVRRPLHLACAHQDHLN